MVIWSHSSIIFRADNLSHLWDLMNLSEFPNLLTSLSPMEALSTLEGLPAVCTIRAKGPTSMCLCTSGPQQCFDVAVGARSSGAGAGSCCAMPLSGITNAIAQRSLCLMRCSLTDTWNRDDSKRFLSRFTPPLRLTFRDSKETTSKQIDIARPSDQMLDVCRASRPNVIWRDSEIECHQMGFNGVNVNLSYIWFHDKGLFIEKKYTDQRDGVGFFFYSMTKEKCVGNVMFW